ncbi:nucleoside diphosphate kinase 6 isoform X4 [Phascolarctos cinereus]|uniref:Nucleoside diphosphate kinase 6 n=1 Tax=Phascolarctos cinereus TaxID=38626 RepID=A0A6P5JFS4_PHACI|nr:nucleoside diphosphate kinase 6 isoform X3 [Phascolarctos cinereus]
MATLGRGGPSLLQLTLALIKPDAVAHPLILEAIHQQILSSQLLIVRTRDLVWRREDCQRFYQEHAGRFFYQRLVEFMASGPIRAYILAHKDAVQLWRTLMGPTRVFRARHVAPDSIRGSFGLTDTRNTTHGSAAGEKKMMSAQAHCLSDVLFLDGFCFQYIEDSLRYKKASKLLEPEKWLPSQMTPNCK